MTHAPNPWLAKLPARLHGPLARAAAGAPANIALMHVLMECAEPDEAGHALAAAISGSREVGDAEAARRLESVRDLLTGNPQAFRVVRLVLDALDHDRVPAESEDAVATLSAAFDRAVRTQPEGSVALYSLGNPDLLEAATAEIVARLDDWTGLSGTTRCLDIGCGTGRFELALAARVRNIVGVDISAAMVDAARSRTAGLTNVELRQTSGRDLAGFTDASFDLVLAADVFPYLVQAGGSLAETMVREAGRVLRPSGHLVVLNYSYRGDLDRDRAELRDSAIASGLELIRNGTSEFSLWDAAAFVLAKPGQS